jgi:hypothetical protein
MPDASEPHDNILKSENATRQIGRPSKVGFKMASGCSRSTASRRA